MERMEQKNKLEDHEWLLSIYAIRHNWPIYKRGILLAGLSAQ